MYSGIALTLSKLKINYVRNDGPKVIDICIPISIKGGREKEPGVVIENHKSHIMNSSYTIGVRLVLGLVSIAHLLSQTFRTTWFERQDECELI
jgi:hypothetical protein